MSLAIQQIKNDESYLKIIAGMQQKYQLSHENCVVHKNRANNLMNTEVTKLQDAQSVQKWQQGIRISI